MIPYVGGVPGRGTLILSCRHSEVGLPVPFLVAFSLPSVATRCPFADGWTVGEHTNYDPMVQFKPSIFCSAVKLSNHLATRPSCTTCIYKIYTWAHTLNSLRATRLKLQKDTIVSKQSFKQSPHSFNILHTMAFLNRYVQ